MASRPRNADIIEAGRQCLAEADGDVETAGRSLAERMGVGTAEPSRLAELVVQATTAVVAAIENEHE